LPYVIAENRLPRLSMTRRVAALVFLALVLLTGWPLAAAAQPAAPAPDEKELLGLRLFNQSCRVCHTKPQLTSPQYGPVLSKNSLGGQADVMRDLISNGTPRMPGFRFSYQPDQIDAIIAYLKTVPAP
jgi:mono/diheme cytochrome c family protein